MKNVWPVFPMFAFASYPEYLEAIAQVEGGVIGEGSAINLVRFQCSIQFLRDLVASRKLRSWAVVNEDHIEHLRYSAVDLVAYGLQVGWFHSFSDLGFRFLPVTEDIFSRLQAEVSVLEAEMQTDWFPDSVTIKHILSPMQAATVPDYLIGLLLRQGNGLLEAESVREDRPIDWRYTRLGQDVPETLYSCPPLMFRPTLGTFASKLAMSHSAGHTFFRVRYENEKAACRGRFSFYWSNSMISGYWAKLYLYDSSPIKSMR